MDNIKINKGFPNASQDAEKTPLDLNKLLIKSSISTFLFTIDTDRWEDIGIFKGDIAIIDRAEIPKKSNLVAISDNDGFTLTKFNDQPEVWGKVTAVIHRY